MGKYQIRMNEQAPSSSKKFALRPLGCLVGIVVWLFFMSLPIFIFMLINQGQLEWGSDPQNQMRIFLLQEVEQEGVGFQWTRPRRAETSCLDTTVYFFMFRGEGENEQNCTCMADLGDRPPPDGCSVP